MVVLAVNMMIGMMTVHVVDVANSFCTLLPSILGCEMSFKALGVRRKCTLQ